MPSVVLYFQVHQPWRLRRYSIFDTDTHYFDDARNAEICKKVADKCYRPATSLMLDTVRRHKGRFRLAYSISGCVLDQMERWCPDVIQMFRDLAATNCCEFLAETSHHSLASVYSRANTGSTDSGNEFDEQVLAHSRRIHQLFGATPTVFRNTELISSNDLAWHIAQMKDEHGRHRFRGMLCEGVDRILGSRSPNFIYTPPGRPAFRDDKPFGLLCKNYRLSDDIAFRFSNRNWAEWPLTPEKFAGWISAIHGTGDLCNLFMDYETIGEHQWADTGIFQFMAALPDAVLANDRNSFCTPAEALSNHLPVDEFDAPDHISWADTERDLSAWRGNAMQSNALEEIFRLERAVKTRYAEAIASGDGDQREEATTLLADWRRLTTSDHFYYMCTKYFADGDVHAYFNPYESPYDSYINFMNVLDNLRTRLAAAATT